MGTYSYCGSSMNFWIWRSCLARKHDSSPDLGWEGVQFLHAFRRNGCGNLNGRRVDNASKRMPATTRTATTRRCVRGDIGVWATTISDSKLFSLILSCRSAPISDTVMLYLVPRSDVLRTGSHLLSGGNVPLSAAQLKIAGGLVVSDPDGPEIGRRRSLSTLQHFKTRKNYMMTE